MLNTSHNSNPTPKLDTAQVAKTNSYITVLSDTLNQGVLAQKFCSSVLIPFYFQMVGVQDGYKCKLSGNASMEIPGILSTGESPGIVLISLELPNTSKVTSAAKYDPAPSELSVSAGTNPIKVTATIENYQKASNPNSDYIDLELGLSFDFEVQERASSGAFAIEGGICIVLETQDPREKLYSVQKPTLQWTEFCVNGEQGPAIPPVENPLFVFASASWPGEVPQSDHVARSTAQS